MRMFAGILFVILCAAPAWAQSTGTVRGVVTLEDTGKPVHNVQVLLLEIGRSAETDDEGKYEPRVSLPEV